MTMERIDSAPRQDQRNETPTLFDLSDEAFMSAVRDAAGHTTDVIESVTSLAEKYEQLRERAEAHADKRGVSIDHAMQEIDTEGIVFAYAREQREKQREEEARVRRAQVDTNTIAINQMREVRNAQRRAEVAAQYPGNSPEQTYRRERALTELEARIMVEERNRRRRS